MTGAELLQLKQDLTGPPVNPYVVVGTSDGMTLGMDNLDRWLRPADAERLGSWCVLRGADDHELLLSASGAWMARAGYQLRGMVLAPCLEGDELRIVNPHARGLLGAVITLEAAYFRRRAGAMTPQRDGDAFDGVRALIALVSGQGIAVDLRNDALPNGGRIASGQLRRRRDGARLQVGGVDASFTLNDAGVLSAAEALDAGTWGPPCALDADEG